MDLVNQYALVPCSKLALSIASRPSVHGREKKLLTPADNVRLREA